MHSASPFSTLSSTLAPERILCAIDRSFLGSVKDTFSGWGMAPETMLTYIGYTVAAAMVILGAGLLVNHYVIKPRHGPPAHWIWRRKELNRIFDQVMAQRAKLDISFVNQGMRSSHRASSLEHIGPDSLELELSSIQDANQTWIGRQLDAVFRLANPKFPAQATFYTMTTEIIGIKKLATGAGLITVQFPEKVIIAQKRMHMRMEPPSRLLLGMAIWPDQYTPTGIEERRIKNWGKPPLIFVAGETDNPFHIENLSGGGIRVGVEREAVRASGMPFEIGEYYIMLLDLHDPEERRKLRFWLMGRIQNRYEDFETRRLSFGLQFTRRGHRLDEPRDEIQWTGVGQAGIDELENWVVQRNLEQYRRTGLG